MLPLQFRPLKEKTFAIFPLLPSAALPAAMWANILDWTTSRLFRSLSPDSEKPHGVLKVAIKSALIPDACKPLACAPSACKSHACTAPVYWKPSTTHENFSSFRGRLVFHDKSPRKLLRFFVAVCFCGFALAGLPLTVEGDGRKC
eukprot:GHVT01092030.1.p1 GENE.GHVT01092030.1~~GHVT01092030.1.p1  ORF type:complete len:145 (+),score=16.67 GHVT01092030.1:222-656(+)